jgi:sirohydrochlorin ferrochelatase
MTTKSVDHRLIIVAHGSKNALWEQAVDRWFVGVHQGLMEIEGINLVMECCWLEVNQPLFEDRLKQIADNDEDVTILPFFLTRSDHAGKEIPEMVQTILGEKKGVTILAATGWEQVLGANLQRRLYGMKVPAETPVVLSGYGSLTHPEEWTSLIEQLQKNAGVFGKCAAWYWAPAGHYLHDAEQPLREVLNSLLENGHQSVAVVPLYLAVSSYQEKLIPRVIDEFPLLKFFYRPDAILPDDDIVEWAVSLLAKAILSPRA